MDVCVVGTYMQKMGVTPQLLGKPQCYYHRSKQCKGCLSYHHCFSVHGPPRSFQPRAGLLKALLAASYGLMSHPAIGLPHLMVSYSCNRRASSGKAAQEVSSC